MDYTAVGTAVNLAARLCAAADDGSILVDGQAASFNSASCEPHGELSLKGLSTPLPVFRCRTV
jgi:class 3 adenylate cyclase